MGRLRLRHGRFTSLGTLVAVTAVLAALLPGVALLLMPAIALFAALLLGFRPGEQMLERIRARRFTRHIGRAPRALAIRRVVVVRRMASLAASALAMRPPPAAPALIS